MILRRGPAAAVLAALLLAAPWPRAQDDGVSAGLPAREDVAALLAGARARLAGLDPAAEAASLAGRQRQALERRITLLEEAVALLDRAAERAGRVAGLPQRERLAREGLRQLDATPEPEVAAEVSQEAFARSRQAVAALRLRVAELRTRIASRRQALESLRSAEAEAQARQAAARQRAADLAEEAAGAGASAEDGEVLALRAENASLDERLARALLLTLVAEADLDRASEPVRLAELELAQRQLERAELEMALVADALEGELAARLAQASAAERDAEAGAAAAHAAADRFLAVRRLDLARSRRLQAERAGTALSLQRAVGEQEKRLGIDEEELAALRELFEERLTTSVETAHRLRYAWERLEQRRQVFRRAAAWNLEPVLHEWRARRFELDEQLFTLHERWRAAREEAFADLAPRELRDARREAAALLQETREQLLEEEIQLGAAIALARRLESLHRQRLEAMDALQRFIRGRTLWLRDAPALGLPAAAGAGRELAQVGSWVRGLAAAGTGSRLAELLKSPAGAGSSLILLVFAPVLAGALVTRLRRVVRRANEQAAATGGTTRTRWSATAAGVGAAVVPAAWLLGLARAMQAPAWPHDVSAVAAPALAHLAVSALALGLGRAFLGGWRIAPIQLGLAADASRSLGRVLVLGVAGHATLVLARRVLLREPFALVLVPRFLFVGIALLVAAVVLLLLWSRSPFATRVLAGTRPRAARWARGIGWLALAGILAGAVLQVAGYESAAESLARGISRSALTIVLLLPPYALASLAVQSETERLRRSRRGADGRAEPPAALRGRLVRFVRLAFLLVAIALVSRNWGLDEQALRAAGEVRLYSFHGGGDVTEQVTLADAARAAVALALTVWLVRALPALMQVATFARWRLDAGSRYALVAIARYVLGAVGVLAVLGALHLDLGRLGWLVAALGVGIGFGLQEIVANFVSGLILLVERPIRVGDVIEVGGTQGTVQRINIRATSVLNWDRKEVIVPNRNLITGEVINWTLADSLVRLIVPIGVAYGTDPDRVTKLLLEIAKADPNVLTQPPPQAVFMAHGASSLDFELRVHVPDPSRLVPARDRLNKSVNRALREAAIEIPFPQQDVHVRTVPAELRQPVGSAGAEARPAEERPAQAGGADG